MKYLIFPVFSVSLFLLLFECHGISIICESNAVKNCTMKMTKDETSLSPDFLNMLPGYRRRDIEGILNDTRYSWDERRDRINNYLKTYIPYDTIKSYSKILSDKLKRQFEDDFQKTRSYLDKIFREKFNFLKFKDGLFPSFDVEFSEKDFERMPGKKYVRDEIYTGPYDRSISQLINTNVDGNNAIISLNRGIDRIPAGGFRGVYRPYRYCIPIC